MNIDLPMLLRQKQAIMRAIDKADEADKGLLYGVLNLLDYVHDEVDPPQMELLR